MRYVFCLLFSFLTFHLPAQYSKIDNGKYNAFGISFYWSNKDYGIAYREGTSHVGDTGIIKILKINAKQQFDSITVFSDKNYDCRNIGGGITKTGRLILFFSRYNPDGNHWIDQGYIYTDDTCKSWSSFIKIDVDDNDGFSPYGALITIANDTLMLPWYGKRGNTWTQYIIKSSDNGATWHKSIIVISDTVHAYAEGSFVYVENTIIGILRAQKGTKYRQVKSIDNGCTWIDQFDLNFVSESYNNLRQVWLSSYMDSLKNNIVVCYYPSRIDRKLYSIEGNAKEIIYRPDGWNMKTIKIIGEFTLNHGALNYCSIIHPYNDYRKFGWYTNEISNKSATINLIKYP